MGSVGNTLDLAKTRSVESSPTAIATLTDDLRAGKYAALFVYGTNPAFSLSQDFAFNYAAKMVPLFVSFSSTVNETAIDAHLILPAHTGLESWGDYNPVAGVHTLQQPSMSPVFDTMQFGDMLLKIAKDSGNELGNGSEDFYSFLKESWKEIHTNSGTSKSFENFWLKSLEQGGWFSTKATTPVKVEVSPAAFKRKFKKAEFQNTGIIVYPYPSIKGFNGEYANKPWMQELPDPMTSVSWSSWVELHPKTAKKYKLEQGDPVTLRNHFGEITVPAYVTKHIAPGIAAVPLGQGHTEYGRYARRVASANVYSLIPKQVTKDDVLPLVSTKAVISRGRGKPLFTVMQGSDDQGDREIAQTEYKKAGSSAATSHAGHNGHVNGHGAHAEGHAHHAPKQMYEQRIHPLYEWAMAVDLESCTGCSACVVACYAENNIATVTNM
ncbi:MAG: molybdopterin dinucleotide binding domain-containing protein [Bdellovibrionota bacterium]